MNRSCHIRLQVVSALAVLAFTVAGPAMGQGALKPLEARIINTPSQPVPVSVIPAAPDPMVTCRYSLGTTGSATTPIAWGSGVAPVTSVSCPAGVTAIDVRRVIYDFDGANAVHFAVFIGYVPPGVTSDISAHWIAMLTNGQADIALQTPVRIDTNDGGTIQANVRCSSGIAGFNVQCGGRVFLIGTPVQ
jgi:hypothetical protein